MGSKNNPGTFDCYSNAMPDEPMFILLARDPYAPWLLEEWAGEREMQIENGRRPSSDMAMVDEARQCAETMRAWRAANDGAWRAPAPPSDESPVGELTLGQRAKLIAEKANECCHRSDGYEEDICAYTLRHLKAAAPTPQPERVTEARVERIAKAMWERTHDGYWPKDAEADATECVNERGEPTRLTTADIYRGDARAALEASLSISSEGEGGWRTMDSAPKDKPFIGAFQWDDTGEWEILRWEWSETFNKFVDATYDPFAGDKDHEQPTHWFPLSPPALPQQGGRA